MSGQHEDIVLNKDDYKIIDVNDPETRKYLSQSGRGHRSSRKESKEEKREKKDEKKEKERKDKKEKKEEKRKDKEDHLEESKDRKESQKEKSYKHDDLLGILSPQESHYNSDEEVEDFEKPKTRKIKKEDPASDDEEQKDMDNTNNHEESQVKDENEDQEGSESVSESENDDLSESGSDNESNNESDNESDNESFNYGSEESVDPYEMVRELLRDFLMTTEEHVPVFERDERGRRLPPRHKNVADLLQELVYLQLGKHKR